MNKNKEILRRRGSQVKETGGSDFLRFSVTIRKETIGKLSKIQKKEMRSRSSVIDMILNGELPSLKTEI